MIDSVSAQAIAGIMSMAVAPVFLISSVAVLVSCMASRYGRVIDRSRTLLRDGDRLYGDFASTDYVARELRDLYQRAQLLRTTIILGAASIFFVVLAIFLIFIDLAFDLSLSIAAVISFLISLVVLQASVGLFIRDFMISLRSLKHDIHTRGQNGVLEAEDNPSK